MATAASVNVQGSRYSPVSNAGNQLDNRTIGTGTQAQVGTQTGVTSTNQTGSTTNNSTTATNQTTRNLSPELEAELNTLTKQLAAGGTPQMQQDRARRIAVINSAIQQQQNYSKASAFSDAQGLIAQQMRRTLESLLPNINRAAEDSGSSGGALRALLLQDAANKASESSSALGVQTAVNYGNINTNLMQVLESLTRPDATVANSLINAVSAGKGAVSQTTGTQTTSGTQNTTSAGTQNTATNSTQNATSADTKSVDYAPFDVAMNTTPQFFGAVAQTDPSKYVGTTLDTLSQLSGGGNPWASYSF